MAVIEVEDLYKAYGGRGVVDGVSFEVARGEIFGLLGPNGAGKSTTVECIEGLRRPDAGRIEVLGLDPHRDGAEVRRRLGVQLQGGQVPEKLRVWEAVDLYASFYDRPADWEELLVLLGLAQLRGQRVGTLSGGQQQRLSVALALVGRPEVAVLDELTTGLDPQARRDTWSLIERVRDTGVTIVLVSHFMDEVERLCDRLAIVDQGRVVTQGTPTEIVRHGSGAHRLRFRPAVPLDDRALTDLDAVASVARRGAEVVVTGSDEVVQAVTAVLARAGIVAHDLRVEQRTLDDAFVALTGRGLGTDVTEEQD